MTRPFFHVYQQAQARIPKGQIRKATTISSHSPALAGLQNL
jgi:hypothetical protein